jgi:hypothetical protein
MLPRSPFADGTWRYRHATLFMGASRGVLNSGEWQEAVDSAQVAAAYRHGAGFREGAPLCT